MLFLPAVFPVDAIAARGFVMLVRLARKPGACTTAAAVPGRQSPVLFQPVYVCSLSLGTARHWMHMHGHVPAPHPPPRVVLFVLHSPSPGSGFELKVALALHLVTTHRPGAGHPSRPWALCRLRARLPPCSCHAPFEYPNEAFPPFDVFAGGESNGNVDLADFDFAADYAVYAPLLQTPTPSPGVGMGYGIGIGATAPWCIHVHGDDENEWVAYTEEIGSIEGGGDEQQQQELSPLVAPAPSPAPQSESESEYSPDEDDNDEEHLGDWCPPVSAPTSGSGSSCSSSSYGAPFLTPPPQPPCIPVEPAHPTPALHSRWSSSTVSSLHSTHGRVRPPRTFSFGRYLPRTRPTTKPKPKSSVACPAPRPMGSVTVLPPPPQRLCTPDYAESSQSS
ncbi:hypothetical protein B0H14DRAFT_3505074 [Mycena olivaceomarginata]|nr:hypothetical protein B0H14DRAFT_3505074 [Mycena olivaceomarginata]